MAAAVIEKKHGCCCHRNYYWLLYWFPIANKQNIETGIMQNEIREEKCKEREIIDMLRTRKMRQMVKQEVFGLVLKPVRVSP